jgi:hypothetical protein
MPPRVDRRALEPVLHLLAGAAGSACVLDFAATEHIEYRAFRGFAARVRTLLPSPRPIVLAGLSAYCRQILRFALGAKDWEVFLALAEEHPPAASWGSGAVAGDGRGLVRERDLAALLAAHPLSPN